MKLSTKIVLSIIVVTILIGSIFTVVTIYTKRQTSTADFKEFSLVLADTVLDSVRDHMVEKRPQHIQGRLEEIKESNPMINEIVIFGKNREAIFSAEEEELGEKTSSEEILNTLETGKINEQVEKKYGEEELCVLLPIKNEASCHGCHGSKESIIGVMELGLDMGFVSERANRDAEIAGGLFIGACLIILGIMMFILRRTILKQLAAIIECIKKFASSDYSGRVEVKSKDELGMLGNAFNNMADKIQKTIAELGRTQAQLDHSLIRFGKLLTTTLNLDEIAHLIVNEIAERVGSDQAIILIRNAEDRLMLVGATGMSPNVIEEYNSEPLVWSAGAPEFSVLIESDHLLINKLQGRQLFSKLNRLYGENDFYIFPLITSERVVGLMTLRAQTDGKLSEANLRTIRLLCFEAATAIDNASVHKMLQQVSITDGLTELYNQRHFFNTLRKEMAGVERYGSTFSVLFLDLDGFKLFNDFFGHDVGDQVLQKVAQVINGQTRVPDHVFRYGGDEFALILPKTNRDEALVLANRIREEIKRTSFMPAGQHANFGLSASVGVICCERHKFREADEIFKAVDDALREAKSAGKDRVNIK